jgi:dihydrolipoamide dehydrogenase
VSAADVNEVELLCPDIGNFKDVTVVDILVAVGDDIAVEAPLVTLETEKATMDVPATTAGRVVAVLFDKNSKISQGTPLVRIAVAAGAAAPLVAAPGVASTSAGAPAAALRVPVLTIGKADSELTTVVAAYIPLLPDVSADRDVQLLVLGAGPGGYTAAFRAADLGLKVTLIERWSTLGGVCLNVGCIPSKALLHAAKIIDEAHEMGAYGVSFGAPTVDLDKLRGWKNKVIGKLTGGLTGLAKQRKIEVVRGVGKFLSPHVLEVTHAGKSEKLRFEQCIIAAGSEPIALPFLPNDPRVMDSTGALELPPTPGRMLVIGGGIIGLEMACVYDALGAKLSVVELTSQLMPGCDLDLVKPLEKRLKTRYEQILLNTKVLAVAAQADGLHVTFEDAKGQTTQVFERVLSAVGRAPNGKLLDADKAGVLVNERGFINVDKQQRTNISHIFAIGDVVGQPMLAHKATHEAKVAAEVAAGQKRYFDARVIPSVAYTDPEVAWVGLTESAAKAQGIAVEKGVFPWAASGRSLSIGRDDGFTKLIIDPKTHRVLGGGIVGPNAGELIAEVALAVEMNADATDIGLTIHPHPTLSETVGMAAEAWEGTLTDLYLPKKKSGHL